MEERKSKTLFVRNLPFTTNNEALEKLFSNIGPLKQCFVVKNKDDEKCKGYGYVTYSLLEDAEKAKNEVKSLDGRKLFISFADKKKDTKIKKSLSQAQKVNTRTSETEDATEDKTKSDNKEALSYLKAKTLVVTGFIDQDSIQTTLDKMNMKNVSKIDFPVKDREDLTAFCRFKSIRDLKKGQKKMESKGLHAVQLSKENKIVPQKLLKQARLIVRNLSFQCTEPHLQQVFSQFGEVSEVKIPKKPDGKMLGFGFVQFTEVMSAKKALEKMNAKMIRGRPVAVDWAIPKKKFEKDSNVESDEESSDMEQDDSDDEHCKGITEETTDESSDDKEDSDSDQEDNESVDEDDDSSEIENSDDESTDEGFEDSSHKKSKPIKNIGRNENVEDGRTLFIRNLSYDTEEEHLSEVMSEFGKINYCRIVIDPKTEHSKGSGFIQFKSSESADSCLQKAGEEGSGIVVDGRKLLVTKAVSREKATDLRKKEKTKEDKRNIHLVREGLVRGGTKAAEGLTKEDLTKRNKIENVKRQRLKNPNIFVSTTRLCLHNLPTSLDEKELKKLLLKAAGNHAKITECRIMRDTDRVNSKGVGKSRGYAFVNFTDHQHALHALRNTNNNADLFSDKRRLIVEFSLENKNALLAKEKRLERFKARQKFLKKEKSADNIRNVVKPESKQTKNKKTGKKQKDKITDRYIGNVKLPEGSNIKNVLPSHWGPKVRHKPRQQKDQGTKMKTQDYHIGQGKRKRENFDMGPGKQRRRKKSEKMDNFDKLVNSYKQRILSSKNTSKWFES